MRDPVRIKHIQKQKQKCYLINNIVTKCNLYNCVRIELTNTNIDLKSYYLKNRADRGGDTF